MGHSVVLPGHWLCVGHDLGELHRVGELTKVFSGRR